MPTYRTGEIATLAGLAAVLARRERPVLLLEGVRALPDADRPLVTAMGRLLAGQWPGVLFRSGNAEGADTAFAEGVASVDPARMEYVLTHAGMGRRRRVAGARAVALADLPHVADGAVGEYTIAASPRAGRLVAAYRERPGAGALAARAAYLLRDTLKVAGCAEIGMAPAAAGLFYANPEDPLAGGTGHTIRVCAELGVPVVLQRVWRRWL